MYIFCSNFIFLLLLLLLVMMVLCSCSSDCCPLMHFPLVGSILIIQHTNKDNKRTPLPLLEGYYIYYCYHFPFSRTLRLHYTYYNFPSISVQGPATLLPFFFHSNSPPLNVLAVVLALLSILMMLVMILCIHLAPVFVCSCFHCCLSFHKLRVEYMKEKSWRKSPHKYGDRQYQKMHYVSVNLRVTILKCQE